MGQTLKITAENFKRKRVAMVANRFLEGMTIYLHDVVNAEFVV